VAVLGIDVGTTNTKAVLVDGDATIVAVRPTPGTGAALLATVAEVVHAVLRDGHVPAAIGIASMAETGTLLLEGEPVGDLLRWQGRRSELEPDHNRYHATGVPFPDKTPIAMLAEMLAKHALPSGARWAGVGDLVGFALTGQLATDPTLAARTGGYRRVPVGPSPSSRFDAELTEPSGLAPEAFPKVLAPGQPLGRVGRDGAGRFGVAVGTPVVLAGHDHAVAAWAAGVRAPGDRGDSLGTTEAIYAIAHRDPDVDAAHAAGASLTPTLEGTATAVVAANPSAGAMLEWFADTRPAELGAIDADAAAYVRERATVVVRPDRHGRQSPVPDPDARVTVITVDGGPAGWPDGHAEALAAVALGLALQARWLLNTTDVIAGPAAGLVTVIPGPLTRSRAWQAAREVVFDRPTLFCPVDEAVAAAAALRAAVVTGLADPGTTFPTETERPPHPAEDAGRWYDAFCDITRPLQTRGVPR
jgi:xylulokinase